MMISLDSCRISYLASQSVSLSALASSLEILLRFPPLIKPDLYSGGTSSISDALAPFQADKNSPAKEFLAFRISSSIFYHSALFIKS